MKMIILMMLLFGSVCYAQEQAESEWKIMPSISVLKHFAFHNRNHDFDVRPMMYPQSEDIRFSDNGDFSATGISFSARFLNKDFEPFAFTLSAGANWYRNGNRSSSFPMPAYGGGPIPLQDSMRIPIANTMYYPDRFGMDSDRFMSFPIGVGAQIVFPYDKIDKLMFFAGAEGNLSFLSRRVAGRHQVEGGFALLGGVAIKIVELGVRYSRFAGSSYVGVQAGIRFHQFSLD